MKPFRSSLGVATLCLIICSWAFTQIPVRTVAYTGQQAPGTNVTFDLFFAPTISTYLTSEVLFTGRLFGSGVDQTNNYGLWSQGGTIGPRLVVRKGDEAPGLPAGARFEHLGFETALLGPHHSIISGYNTVFFATLTGGGIAAGTRSAWIAGIARPTTVVAYAGQSQGLSTLGPVFTPVRFNGASPGFSSISYSSAVYTNVFSTDTIALWTSATVPDSTGRIPRRSEYRSRDQVPGLTPGLLFGHPLTHLICDNGTVVFQAGIYILSGMQFGSGIWSRPLLSPIQPVVVALNGVPVVLPGLNTGESISQFDYVLANSSGNVAFTATISGSPGGYGFWSQDTGSWRLVMRAGMAAPGLPVGVTFHSLSESSTSPRCLFYTNLYDVIFLARLQGTGVTSANDLGVWMRSLESSTEMIAREGDQMPGAAAGVVFDRITRVAANALGEIVIEATIRGTGITTANNQGLWARNGLGQFVPLVQKGGSVEVEPGVMRTVNAVTLAVGDPEYYSTGADGRSTVFSHRTKELALYASFLDNAVVVNAICVANTQSIFTDVDNVSNRLPFAFALHQNYPNPFNPSTTIRYELPRVGLVSLKVFDILGREIATLVNEVQDAGLKSVKFDAAGLASGVYFYRLNAGSFSASKKLLIVK